MTDNKIIDKIEHIIYIMFENNSFHHLFGGFSEFNLPNQINYPSTSTTKTMTELDLPHSFNYVIKQVGIDKNKKPNNQGFTKTLIEFDKKEKISSTKTKKRIIEQHSYLKPGTLPIFHKLAKEYTICNNYFSSYPGGTFCNRFFALTGTSKGEVYNLVDIDLQKNITIDPYIQDQITIFDRLNEKNISWKCYHSGTPLVGLLSRIWLPQNLVNLKKMENFYKDIKNNNLPTFSLIEPKFIGKGQNDMHPPTDLLCGDNLLGNIYTALRSNPKIWNKCLLIVNFDEHGGFYDGVPPPKTIAPDSYTQNYLFN